MATQQINSNFYRSMEASSFTQIVVIPLTRAVVSRLPAPNRVPYWVRRLVFRAALKRAYASFAGYYPQWAAALFDEHFLQHGAASLSAGYFENGRLPQANELVLAWEAQLGLASPWVHERRIAELTPVAADFLDWLMLELAVSPFS